MNDQMTDKTIIVKCGECDIEATGVDTMTAHIIDHHPEYSAVEARNFAEQWTEDAHHEYEVGFCHYNEDRAFERKLDRVVTADIDFAKHKT